MNVIYSESGCGAVMVSKNQGISDAVCDTMIILRNISDSVRRTYDKGDVKAFENFIKDNIDIVFMDDDCFEKAVKERIKKLDEEKKASDKERETLVKELKSSIKDLGKSCPDIADDLSLLAKAIDSVEEYFNGGDDE